MKILHLVTVRQRRGAEVVANDLADAMCERGYEAIVVGLSAPPAEPLDPMLAHVIDLPQRGSARLDFRRIMELGRIFRREAPDVVQANGGFAVKYAVLAAALYRTDVPIIYCNIGMSSDWLRWPGQRAWNRWLLNHTSFTAAVSDTSRQDLITTYRLPEDRVRVVRRGLATEPVFAPDHGRAILARDGVPIQGAILMHVGSFTPEKNHSGLLRIFERIRDAHPSTVMVLVGDGELRANVDALEIPGVYVLGTRSDVPELLSAAHVLVLPSLTEGIPGTVLEAAVQRVPTVAYDVGGIDEVVIDAETGLVIQPGDESAAAEAVMSLLDNEQRRRALGEAARDFVCREYDLDRSVDAFLDLYEDALTAATSMAVTR